MFRLVSLILAALLLTPVAQAAEARKLAIMSVMGDSLDVVTHRPAIGSSIDKNQHDSLKTGDGVIDTLVLNETIAAIQHAGAQNATEVQALSYPGAHGNAAWFEGKRFAPPADLAAALAQTSATHLLLIQAHRAPSTLKARHASVGSGYLEGLGFYIDRELKMRRSDNGQVGVGFLAPYAYIKLQLINLASGETEREQVLTASSTISSAKNAEGDDPWNALDAAQKIAAIRRLLRAELNRALPELLQR